METKPETIEAQLRAALKHVLECERLLPSAHLPQIRETIQYRLATAHTALGSCLHLIGGTLPCETPHT